MKLSSILVIFALFASFILIKADQEDGVTENINLDKTDLKLDEEKSSLVVDAKNETHTITGEEKSVILDEKSPSVDNKSKESSKSKLSKTETNIEDKHTKRSPASEVIERKQEGNISDNKSIKTKSEAKVAKPEFINKKDLPEDVLVNDNQKQNFESDKNKSNIDVPVTMFFKDDAAEIIDFNTESLDHKKAEPKDGLNNEEGSKKDTVNEKNKSDESKISWINSVTDPLVSDTIKSGRRMLGDSSDIIDSKARSDFSASQAAADLERASAVTDFTTFIGKTGPTDFGNKRINPNQFITRFQPTQNSGVINPSLYSIATANPAPFTQTSHAYSYSTAQNVEPKNNQHSVSIESKPIEQFSLEHSANVYPFFPSINQRIMTTQKPLVFSKLADISHSSQQYVRNFYKPFNANYNLKSYDPYAASSFTLPDGSSNAQEFQYYKIY